VAKLWIKWFAVLSPWIKPDFGDNIRDKMAECIVYFVTKRDRGYDVPVKGKILSHNFVGHNDVSSDKTT